MKGNRRPNFPCVSSRSRNHIAPTELRCRNLSPTISTFQLSIFPPSLFPSHKPKLGFLLLCGFFTTFHDFAAVFALFSSHYPPNVGEISVLLKILQQMSTKTIPFLGLFCKYPEKVQLFLGIVQIQFSFICRVVAHRGD